MAGGKVVDSQREMRMLKVELLKIWRHSCQHLSSGHYNFFRGVATPLKVSTLLERGQGGWSPEEDKDFRE
jgi:hypothetical protein